MKKKVQRYYKTQIGSTTVQQRYKAVTLHEGKLLKLITPITTDEDMTLMHTTMIGAWNGVEEVQQGFPSQQGGPRLIRFESLRWRPKAIQVRVQFGVQEQCAIKQTPRSHTESVLDVLYMVGRRIS
jgi:hypothetical protein